MKSNMSLLIFTFKVTEEKHDIGSTISEEHGESYFKHEKVSGFGLNADRVKNFFTSGVFDVFKSEELAEKFWEDSTLLSGMAMPVDFAMQFHEYFAKEKIEFEKHIGGLFFVGETTGDYTVPANIKKEKTSRGQEFWMIETVPDAIYTCVGLYFSSDTKAVINRINKQLA